MWEVGLWSSEVRDVVFLEVLIRRQRTEKPLNGLMSNSTQRKAGSFSTSLLTDSTTLLRNI